MQLINFICFCEKKRVCPIDLKVQKLFFIGKEMPIVDCLTLQRYKKPPCSIPGWGGNHPRVNSSLPFQISNNPILVTSFLVVLGHEVTKILCNSLFTFHFTWPKLPYKRKTSYRKSHNISDEKPKTKLPKYVMSRAKI